MSYFLFILTTPSCATCCFFFFNDTATTEIYTLSLHDALPICVFVPIGVAPSLKVTVPVGVPVPGALAVTVAVKVTAWPKRSEEHTSELQSQSNLVCRLLLEKKKKKRAHTHQRNISTSGRSHVR